MRESDFCFPSQQRATITLTTTLYDRRALDSRAPLPLLNSLTQLSLLTSTSSRMREILTQDGGLERLVQLLHTKTPGAPGREGWIWMLSFHCLAHIGVRGTEQVRTRVVEAGGLGVVIRILAGWLRQKDAHGHGMLDRIMGESVRGVPMRREIRPRGQGFGEALLTALADLSLRSPSTGNLNNPNPTTANNLIPSDSEFQFESSNPQRVSLFAAAATASPSMEPSSLAIDADLLKDDTTIPEVSTMTYKYVRYTPPVTNQRRTNIDRPVPHYNESDCLLSLQLLAYLSKYPHLRRRLRTDHDPLDVFGLVERFCARHHPAELQYWAGIVMRNGCRKDEPVGANGLSLLVDDESSLRYCARIGCKKRETVPREFAKCRRCRRAKYCSKECQSRAWSDGHKYWCVERGSPPPQSTTGMAAPVLPGGTVTPVGNGGGVQQTLATAPQGADMVHSSSSSTLLPGTEDGLVLSDTAPGTAGATAPTMTMT